MSARTVNPAPGRLSSPFAPARRHPITGVVKAHNGADVANILGTPVRAARAGTVRTGYEEAGGGHWVFVTSGDVETRYLHLSRRDVRPGQTVKAGQQIGLMGSTGASTGVHLHFEVRAKGVPTDPVAWLAARGVILGVDQAPTTATASPTPQEVLSMILRLGKPGPTGKYLLVSGGRSAPVSHATAKAAKGAGVPVFGVTAAEWKVWA